MTVPERDPLPTPPLLYPLFDRSVSTIILQHDLTACIRPLTRVLTPSSPLPLSCTQFVSLPWHVRVNPASHNMSNDPSDFEESPPPPPPTADDLFKAAKGEVAHPRKAPDLSLDPGSLDDTPPLPPLISGLPKDADGEPQKVTLDPDIEAFLRKVQAKNAEAGDSRVWAWKTEVGMTLNNPIRKLAIKCMEHPSFQITVLGLILFNTITLAMTSNSPFFKQSSIGIFVNAMEYVFVIGFGIEFVFKFIALGFIHQPGTYIRDGWNILDFVVVVLGVVSLAMGDAGSNASSIRVMRVFRPLRAIQGIKGMRVLVNSILKSIPMLLDVVLLCAFVFFIMGIVGVNVFSGVLGYRCNVFHMKEMPTTQYAAGATYPESDVLWFPVDPVGQDPTWADTTCSGRKYIPGTTTFKVNENQMYLEPSNYGPENMGLVCPWPVAEGKIPTYAPGMLCRDTGQNPNNGVTSFDNILQAWLTIFQCITLEGWVDVTYHVEDAMGPLVWIYFVFLILLGGLFMINLFLAVLFLQFSQEGDAADAAEEREAAEQKEEEMAAAKDAKARRMSELDNAMALAGTESQKARLAEQATKVMLSPTMPVPRDPPPKRYSKHGLLLPEPGQFTGPNWWVATRTLCWGLYHNKPFDLTTSVVIICNTIVMATEYWGMSTAHQQASEYINYTFTAYFAMEMIIKNIGVGPKTYWRRPMDAFDGFIVFASLVEIILNQATSLESSTLSVLRAFRIFRLFKLAKSWKELQKLLRTMLDSLSSISYLSLILLVIIVIFALLGQEVFGYNFDSCSVENSKQFCPFDGSTPCPDHFDCYVACNASEKDTWIQVEGSPYNGYAYCQEFPQSTYMAQVGKSTTLRSNFDNFGFSMLSIFQILTGENWNEILWQGMSVSIWFSVTFHILIFIIGNYVILNLFLAILLDQFSGYAASQEKEEKEEREAALKDEESLVDEGKAKKGKYKADAEAEAEAGPTAESIQQDGDDQQDFAATPAPPKKVTMAVDDVKGDDAARSTSDIVPGYAGGIAEARGETELPPDMENLTDAAEVAASMDYVSCFCLSGENKFRQLCAAIITHKAFEWSILFLIIVSSIALILDNPWLDKDSPEKKVLSYMDIAFFAVFALEATLKIIALGLYGNPHAYLKSGFNILDIVIVLLSFVVLLFDQVISVDAGSLGFIRALRTVRALRPMRMAVRYKGLRLVVGALFSSIPAMGNVVLVCLLFFIIFGIMGVNFFAGLYARCIDISNSESIDCYYYFPYQDCFNKQLCDTGSITTTGSWFHSRIGINLPTEVITTTTVAWRPYPYTFNNIGAAILTLFEVATLEVWLNIMYVAMDTRGFDPGKLPELVPLQPILNANPWYALYFVFFVIVGAFFILNLFVGVTIDKFNEMKSEKGAILLTANQQQWLAMRQNAFKAGPAKRPERPLGNPLRKMCYDVWEKPQFDAFIIIIILINVLFMAMEHYKMSPEWTMCMFVSNLIFSAIYSLEAIIKLLAIGFGNYFKDGWNRFDFLIVMVAWVGIALDLVPGINAEQLSFIMVLRVARIGRIFRLIPKAKGLRTLFQTLISSLPALWNVGSMLLLFLFIYAVMGMQLFGLVMRTENVNRQANFETFGRSIATLFRMATGESWNAIMHDTVLNEACMFMLKDKPELNLLYGEYVNGPDGQAPNVTTMNLKSGEDFRDQCGPGYAFSIIFFVSFILLIAFIMFNLVIAIILDNFQNTNEDENMPVTQDDLNHFRSVWSMYDPNGTGALDAANLPVLIAALDPPLGVKGLRISPAFVQQMIMSCDIPCRRGQVHYTEVVYALSQRAALQASPNLTDELTQLHVKNRTEERKFWRSMNKQVGHDPSKPAPFSAGHYHAALYVQAAVRGYLVRFRDEQAAGGVDGGGARAVPSTQRGPGAASAMVMAAEDSLEDRGNVIPLRNTATPEIRLSPDASGAVPSEAEAEVMRDASSDVEEA